MKEKKENFIYFSQKVFWKEFNCHLDCEELYVYAFLHMTQKVNDHICFTNCDILHEKLRLLRNRQDGLKKVQDILRSLNMKGYIVIDTDDWDNLRKCRLLEIKVNIKFDHNYGYFKMSYKSFDDVNDPLSYALLAYINSVSWKGRNIPYDELCDHMYHTKGSYTRKTIYSRLKDLQQNGIISIVNGERYCVNESKKEWKQASNEYVLAESGIDLSEYEDVTKLPVPDKEILEFMGEEDYLKQLIRKLPRKLEYKHFKWVHEYPIPGLKDAAYMLRFNKMRNNGFDFGRWEDKFKSEGQKQDQGQKMQERQDEDFDPTYGHIDIEDDPFEDWYVGAD